MTTRRRQVRQKTAEPFYGFRLGRSQRSDGPMLGSLIHPFAVAPEHLYAYALGKAAAVEPPSPSYSMSGLLYVSERTGKPFALLTVPNALVRGVFDALHEPGIELPLLDGRLDAHVTVIRPEEIEQLGGTDVLQNDRGKPFRYSLGRLVELEPTGWADVARVWCLTVHSPALQELRRSHGLSSLPNDGKNAFHVSVAIRRRGVLGRNETTKETAAA